MFSIFAKKITPALLVDKHFPKVPGDNTLFEDIRTRIKLSCREVTDGCGGWTQALNAGLLSRWELAYYDKSIKNRSEKLDKQMLEAMQFADALLLAILEQVKQQYPKELLGWVLPRGIPVNQSTMALGPLAGKLKVVAALGRETPLPAV